MVINQQPITSLTVNGQTIFGGEVTLAIPGGTADPITGEVTFPVASGSIKMREVFTLNGTDITNKFILVTADITSDSDTEFKVSGLAPQFYSESYVVDGVNKKKVKWNGLALDGLLLSGDVVEVLYI